MKKGNAVTVARLALWMCSLAVLNEVFSAIEQTATAAPAARQAAGKKRAPAASSAQLQGYLARLRSKLIRNWEPTDGKNSVLLEAVVEPNGAVSDIKTSNSRATDIAIQTATMAFEKVQPLESLPISEKNPGKLTITFTSSVDPHGDSTSNIVTRIDPLPTKPVAQDAKAPAAGDNSQASPNK
jgi:hypothetical protein